MFSVEEDEIAAGFLEDVPDARRRELNDEVPILVVLAAALGAKGRSHREHPLWCLSAITSCWACRGSRVRHCGGRMPQSRQVAYGRGRLLVSGASALRVR